MLRHPAEIVASARKSYGPGLTAAGRTAAWINVTLQTERSTRDARRAFVRYDDLLADWAPEIRRIGALLDAPRLAGAERVPEVDAFVDPTLHRNRTTLGRPRRPGRRCATSPSASGRRSRRRRRAGARRVARGYLRLYGEAEAIAQCSIMAARPARQPARPAPKRRAAKPPPTLRVRIARRIPAPYRRRLRRLVGK